MAHLRRLVVGMATALILLTLAAGTALAGGSATVTIIDDGDVPTAGGEREIRFVLLQHGVTPVDDGPVSLTATLPGTDETITVPAIGHGGGEWSALVTFPTAGGWQLHVTHAWLATPESTGLSVGAPPAPVWLSGAVIAVSAALAGAAVAIAAKLSHRPRREATLAPAAERLPTG